MSTIHSTENQPLQFINYYLDGRIGYIVLNRPEKRNALNYEVVSELKQAFETAEADDACKVIVLKAEGPVFCAGADLEYIQKLQNNSYQDNLDDSTHLMQLFHQIYTLKKVVIGQIHGHAIAGGCGLATICDFAFTVPEARFGYTEVKIGFLPAIVMVFLIRKIGEAKAKEILLTGDLISAETAQAMGLINYVTDPANLETEVKQFAQKLCTQNSAQSMEITKDMIARVQEMSLKKGLGFAAEQNAIARSSADCQRGIAAFLTKEKLEW